MILIYRNGQKQALRFRGIYWAGLILYKKKINENAYTLSKEVSKNYCMILQTLEQFSNEI
jgi:hypothetical protein